jgi:formylglycine-generating enzyme required for sulfatase activity
VLVPFELASRPATNAEYLAFVEDGGYRRPELWLSEGWSIVMAQGWQVPLYWRRDAGGWREFTLRGLEPLDPHGTATHLSHFEADAYARWAGARLPTEFEWEHAAPDAGAVWEWTSSSYGPYPGYRPAPGAVGEYNGKFMSNQYVLRGSSCATPAGHARRTYRNFFSSVARWQFSGVRLARDAG